MRALWLRWVLTALFAIAIVLMVGLALVAGMDPEGRGGRYILTGCGTAIMLVVFLILTWTCFR